KRVGLAVVELVGTLEMIIDDLLRRTAAVGLALRRGVRVREDLLPVLLLVGALEHAQMRVLLVVQRAVQRVWIVGIVERTVHLMVLSEPRSRYVGQGLNLLRPRAQPALGIGDPLARLLIVFVAGDLGPLGRIRQLRRLRLQ